MDIGLAFVLGILVGQWILLFAIWGAVSRLAVTLTQVVGQVDNPPDYHHTIIDWEEEKKRRSRF